MEPAIGESIYTCLSCAGVWRSSSDVTIPESVLVRFTDRHTCPTNAEALAGLSRYCPGCVGVTLSEVDGSNRMVCPRCTGIWTIVDVNSLNPQAPPPSFEMIDDASIASLEPVSNQSAQTEASSASPTYEVETDIIPLSFTDPLVTSVGPVQLDIPEPVIPLPIVEVPTPLQVPELLFPVGPVDSEGISKGTTTVTGSRLLDDKAAPPLPEVKRRHFTVKHPRETVIRTTADNRRWCPLCYQLSTVDAGRCFQCGVALVIGSYLVTCGSCGSQIEISNDVCPQCGDTTRRGAPNSGLLPTSNPQDTFLNYEVSPLWILLALFAVGTLAFILFGT